MPRGGPADRFRTLERRKAVAARYLRGEPQWSIGRALEVSQQTVSADLAAIRQEWLAACVRDFDQAKAQELARVDEVERAAWQGWAKSQENAETLRAERSQGADKAVKISRGQAGDPRFLKIILGCIERRCAICGIDAEKRLKITGLIGYANLSDDELDRRIADAQGRIGGTLGVEGPAPGAGGGLEASGGAADGGPGE